MLFKNVTIVLILLKIIFLKFRRQSNGFYSENLIENDFMAYYIDIDYLFSLGEDTIDITKNYGARIEKIFPVGSVFMEYYWFKKPKKLKKYFDLTMLGMNIMNSYERFDKYNNFMEDYYNTIRWLVKFKNDNPELKVAVKHHSSAGEDKIENDILSCSDVEIIPKDNSFGNSYEIAFKSKCVVTYGSTMTYEMNIHGVPRFSLIQNHDVVFYLIKAIK